MSMHLTLLCVAIAIVIAAGGFFGGYIYASQTEMPKTPVRATTAAGSIVNVFENSIQVKDRSGAVISFTITPTTKFVYPQVDAPKEAATVGANVFVVEDTTARGNALNVTIFTNTAPMPAPQTSTTPSQ